MSRLTGSPGSRWPLAQALDDLRESARRAARSGWIWIAGLLYPSVTLGYAPGGALDHLLAEWDGRPPEIRLDSAAEGILVGIAGLLLIAIAAGPLMLIWSRLNAGLARLAPAGVWDRVGGEHGSPGLSDCWRAGRGLTVSVLGLGLSVTFLRVALLALMSIPALFAWNVIDEFAARDLADVVLALLALPLLAILLIYNLLLSLLQQLAMQSLVHNRRGVASALQHAWSLLRHDPWASGRAFLGELVLALFQVTVMWLGLTIAYALPHALGLLGTLAAIPLALAVRLWFAGMLGVARAGYWARAYRGLGGLSPEDGVPGLEDLSRFVTREDHRGVESQPSS